MSKPIIQGFHPAKLPELTAKIITITGEFEATATVTFDGTAPVSTTNVSTSEIQIEILGTFAFGDKEIQVTNPSDGKKSDAIPYTLTSSTSIGGRSRSNALVNQKIQPMVASFRGRTDVQRISATNDYTGTASGAEDGTTESDRGGLWMYNTEVQITRIDFNSAAAEARTAPSGFYLVDKFGHETKIIDLEASSSNAVLTDKIVLAKGEYIKCATVDATQAMVAKVTHHVYNRRNT